MFLFFWSFIVYCVGRIKHDLFQLKDDEQGKKSSDSFRKKKSDQKQGNGINNDFYRRTFFPFLLFGRLIMSQKE